jgi:hypothetical protein
VQVEVACSLGKGDGLARGTEAQIGVEHHTRRRVEHPQRRLADGAALMFVEICPVTLRESLDIAP